MAPTNTGWPQNAVSSLLWIRTCFSHSVSGGSGWAGITFVSSIFAVAAAFGSQWTLWTSLYKLPGAVFSRFVCRLSPM